MTIGIKSFLRFEKLKVALTGIQNCLPECRVIVADDSGRTGLLATLPTDASQYTVVTTSFDCGFGHKSNQIADRTDTKYLLIGSDDFDFNSPLVRSGVEHLVDVLDQNDGIDIASGRVNARPYEFNLLDEGDQVTELPITVNHADIKRGLMYCGLTVNFFLMRTNVYPAVHWDDDVKIGGGEHGAFFLDCKRAGIVTVYVLDVNIQTQPGRDSIEYMIFRNRALAPERPCFDKRGIKKYVLGDGTVDYDATIDRS